MLRIAPEQHAPTRRRERSEPFRALMLLAKARGSAASCRSFDRMRLSTLFGIWSSALRASRLKTRVLATGGLLHRPCLAPVISGATYLSTMPEDGYA